MNKSDDEEGESDKHFYSVFNVNKLDVLAHLIRTDISMEETKASWFQKSEKWANGHSILKWIKEHIEKDDKKAEEIGQKMLDQDIIFRDDNSEVFQGGHTVIYKFYEDRADIASNLLRSWKEDVEWSLDVSAALVTTIGEIYKESIIEIDDRLVIDSEEALKSSKYDNFINNIAQLEAVDLQFETFNEGLCFFLNIYQCMYLHYFLKNGNDMEETDTEKGLLPNLMNYFWSKSNDSFFYNIGGYTFTLEELKHSLLRGNQKPLYSFFRLMGDMDERVNLLDKLSDPRILFVYFDKGQIPKSIECFDDPDTLDDKFDELLIIFFNEKLK